MHKDSEQEKVVVIGGITGGIGKALEAKLKDSGHKVTGFSQSGEGAEACDATCPKALESYFKSCVETHGRIDAYVHAIGSIYLKPAHLTPASDWDQVILHNLNSAFYALRAALPNLMRQDDGRILFFSSVAAQAGIANHEAIAAAKGGIEGMVRSAAASYASKGVRINAIAPSLTDTPLSQGITASPQALAYTKKMHPLGAINTAEDVSSLAQWLLSDAAAQVTGQIFVMDGGLSTIVPKPKA